MVALIWSWFQPFAAVILPAIVLASPWIFSAIPVAGPVAASVLRWRPPIPLYVLIAAAAWAWLDRDGAIMLAAKSATKDLVAGEELAGAKARADGLQVIIDVQASNLADDRRHLAELQGRLIDATAADDKGLKDDLDANARKRAAAGSGCRDPLGDDFWNRLRNR